MEKVVDLSSAAEAFQWKQAQEHTKVHLLETVDGKVAIKEEERRLFQLKHKKKDHDSSLEDTHEEDQHLRY